MNDNAESRQEAETEAKNLEVSQSCVDGKAVAVVSDDADAGQWIVADTWMLMDTGTCQ